MPAVSVIVHLEGGREKARRCLEALAALADEPTFEAILVDENGLQSVQAVEPSSPGALCIFEFFYLARPDTMLAGIEVHGARLRMGERLAHEAPVEADLVMPIPDSGTPAAITSSPVSGSAGRDQLLAMGRSARHCTAAAGRVDAAQASMVRSAKACVPSR